ncbi:hypothetical protein [Flavobacterium phage FL-1]|nr:hypothetical protein [Flavobacterium phage FL-1]
MNEEIRSISRSWIYPNTKGSLYTEECYSVGIMGVSKISQNDFGSFNVIFETGEIISVTDVQYVEYITHFETVFSKGEKPEFPKDRENVQ